MNSTPSQELSASQLATLRGAIERAVVSGARAPLVFGTIVVLIGAALSLLIPQVGPRGSRQTATEDEDSMLVLEESEAMAESVATQ